MHNRGKDGMSVSEINRLLYTGSYLVEDRLGLMGKKNLRICNNVSRRRNPCEKKD